MATDVLGRVIEIVSGQALDEFLSARILLPLGMPDTSFFVSDQDAPRLAALYTPRAGGKAARLDAPWAGRPGSGRRCSAGAAA